MIKRVAAFFLVFTSYASCYEPLDHSYCIAYGDPNADIKIREYFSFSCPQCIAFFKNDFQTVKESYIDEKKVRWEFHPVPMDLVTVQAMICLEKLDEKHKQMFLEAVLMESEDITPNIVAMMMQKAMDIFQKPVDTLQDIDYVESTPAFSSAFRFLNQQDTVKEVPTIEVDGKQYQEMPDMKLVAQIVKENLVLGSPK